MKTITIIILLLFTSLAQADDRKAIEKAIEKARIECKAGIYISGTRNREFIKKYGYTKFMDEYRSRNRCCYGTNKLTSVYIEGSKFYTPRRQK